MNTDPVSIEIDDGGAIVVTGEIDMAAGPIIDAAITTQEERGLPVVIDLRAVTFIDSSGLRSLLGASRRAQDREATVVLRAVGPEVARLLDITGTTRMFEIEVSS
jgi:anti-sigma B factor antagonist